MGQPRFQRLEHRGEGSQSLHKFWGVSKTVFYPFTVVRALCFFVLEQGGELGCLCHSNDATREGAKPQQKSPTTTTNSSCYHVPLQFLTCLGASSSWIMTISFVAPMSIRLIGEGMNKTWSRVLETFVSGRVGRGQAK